MDGMVLVSIFQRVVGLGGESAFRVVVLVTDGSPTTVNAHVAIDVLEFLSGVSLAWPCLCPRV